MFKIKKIPSGKYIKLRLFNSETEEYAGIIPRFGGNINELVLRKNGENFPVVDGDKNPADLLNNKRFKGIKLTPFPNRIKDAVYSFQGKKYQLPMNFKPENHAIHGFLYDKNFDLKRTHEGRASAFIDLEYTYKKELSSFPFHFHIKIRYTLRKKGFQCKTAIKNLGPDKMPLGDGWHPYFKTGGKVDDLWLKLPSQKKIAVDKNMIPSGKKIRFDKFRRLSRIGRQKFDTGFVLPINESRTSTELYDNKRSLKIIVWQETGKMKYKYLHVFIPPDRNSIAIEPMTCNANAFNNKEGLMVLKANEVFQASFGVYLE